MIKEIIDNNKTELQTPSWAAFYVFPSHGLLATAENTFSTCAYWFLFIHLGTARNGKYKKDSSISYCFARMFKYMCKQKVT